MLGPVMISMRRSLAVPDLRGGSGRDDRRFSAARHPVVRKLVEIRSKQGKPVRGVTEQIAVEEHGRNIQRDVGTHASALEQRLCKRAQFRRCVAEFVGTHRSMQAAGN